MQFDTLEEEVDKMTYQGVPGWVRRRKIKPGQYEVLWNGKAVAIAQLEGRYNVDNYPWGWYTVDGLTPIDTGNAESLGRAIEDIYEKVMRPMEEGGQNAV